MNVMIVSDKFHFLMLTSTSRPSLSTRQPLETLQRGVRGRQGILEQWRIRSSPELQVIEKRLENCKVQLTLTVPPESNREIFDKYVKRHEDNSRIPGFRKGQTVPLPLLIRYCGGEQNFNGGILQQIIETSTEKALSKWQGKAIADSDRLETNVHELLQNFDPDQELKFSISFDIMSDIKWTAPFQEIKIVVEDVGDEETDKKNVEKYIREFLKKHGMQRIVQGRGLEQGDTAILDIEFLRPDNREPLPTLKQEKFSFDTDDADPLGIIDKVKGIKQGDVIETEIVFPDDWIPQTFRGLETVAIVTCHELFEWDLPELTDEILQSLETSSFKTVEDFKESLLIAETGRRAERLKDKVQECLMEELVKIVDMEVSETALLETAKVRYQKMLLEYQSQGKIAPAALKSLTTEPMLHNYMMSHKAEIENDQKATAAMDAIFKELKLEVSEEEIQEEVDRVEKEFKEMNEEYDLERIKEMAVDILSHIKVMDWFVKNKNITILPYPSDTTQ